MAEPERVSVRKGIVLWEKGALSCTCLVGAPDNIEISLRVNGHRVERKRFTDPEEASQYAIDKMHAYNAG